MPYRVHDLAAADLDAAALRDCAVVLLGHDNIGLSLTPAAQAALLDAVADGLVLVKLDCSLTPYDESFTDAIGLVGLRRGRPIGLGAATSVGVPAADH